MNHLWGSFQRRNNEKLDSTLVKIPYFNGPAFYMSYLLPLTVTAGPSPPTTPNNHPRKATAHVDRKQKTRKNEKTNKTKTRIATADESSRKTKNERNNKKHP